MFNISSFFNKYRNIESGVLYKRSAAARIMGGILRVPVDCGAIKIKNGVVYVKSTPHMKLSVLMKKEKILEEIKRELPEVIDIK